MSVHVEVVIRLGQLELDVALQANPGETVALLGPNGAGKTTLLRAVAGLHPIDEGRILIADTVVDEPVARRFVPPEARSVGMVFQDYLLFAHLSALENVAFGLRARGLPKADARQRAAAWLDRLGLGDHANSRPSGLSGGQAQRVALARALVTEPDVLLLDEPLAALDASTRHLVRRDLSAHLDDYGGARLLVTHDPVDASVLADRVVVIEAGRVVQTGTMADITSRPRSTYVAQLAGINLVAGTLAAGHFTTLAGAELVVPVDEDADGGPAFATIAPSAVALHRTTPTGSPRNVWQATVEGVDQYHDRVRVTLAGHLPLVAEVTAAAVNELDLRPGDTVWASIKATEVTTFAR